jgi:hypothetical protein
MRIGVGRAFLAMRWTGGVDMQQPSGSDLNYPVPLEAVDWN